MGRIGGGELLLILLIALLIFGPSKLSDMGKGLGEGLKNFKKGLSQEDDDAKPADTAAKAAEPPKQIVDTTIEPIAKGETSATSSPEGATAPTASGEPAAGVRKEA